ncbi:hypothetical protein D6777_04125 [Candidatus Woesearchaeota archaeon]|nr:MAG: hypothetical protein D6777_04125 [Candidatus Woesearchaeota archaeon]
MRSKKQLLIIILLIILATLHFSSGEENATSTNTTINNIETPTNITTNDIESPITLIYDNDKVLVGEKLEGKIKIKLNQTISPDEEIELKLLSKSKKIKIKDLLDNASISYSIKENMLEKSNPESSKTITFTQDGNYTIGVLLPRFSQVHSVKMDVSGPANNNIKIPRMDIGNDGTIDWFYLGDFDGFEQDSVVPEGLNEDAPGRSVFLNDNKTYFCQKIDLPFAQDFDVYAKYKKTGSMGNISALILAPFEGNFNYLTGGDDNCDMEESDVESYHHCITKVQLNYAAKGEHLVCVYNAGGYELDGEGNPIQDSNEYVVRADNSETSQTAYKCVSESEGDFQCSPITTNNFFIKVKPGKYTQYLRSSIDFDKYELGPRAVLNSFRKYVGSNDDNENPFNNFPGVCQEESCLLPITIYVNGSGEITISNLDVRYFYEVEQAESQIFDVVKAPPIIEKINNKNLETEAVTIEIPLSLFDFEVPDMPISYLKSYNAKIKVKFMGYDDEAELTVYKDTIPLEGAMAKINETEFYINQILADNTMTEFLEMLQIKPKLLDAKAQLANLRLQAQGAEDDTTYIEQLETLKEGLVKSVKQKRAVSDVGLVNLNDIKNEMLQGYTAEEVLRMQDDFNVKFSVKTYEVEDYNGNVEKYNLVKKTITAKATAKKVSIYEEIPKSVAYSVNEITFSETPDIVKPDPIVKWFVQNLRDKEITYVVKSNIDVYDETKTIVVKEKEVEEVQQEEDEDECGDNVCGDTEDEESCPEDCKEPSSSFVWVLVVILVAAGGLFLLVKLGVINLGKKSPFANKAQEDAVVKFVRSMKAKGKKDEEIQKMLLGKGWSKDHVQYVFELIKQNPVNPALVKYVAAARKKGMTDEQIRNVLLQQKWPKEQVEAALKQKV